MELNELISKLRDISNMRSASHFKRTICKMAAQKLEAQQARIAELEVELKDERYRHDRVQDFEVAEVRKERDELPAIVEHIAPCEDCAHWDFENEMCVRAEYCGAGEGWIWRGATNIAVVEKEAADGFVT